VVNMLSRETPTTAVPHRTYGTHRSYESDPVTASASLLALEIRVNPFDHPVRILFIDVLAHDAVEAA